jgi:hypothetical protein
MRTSIKRGIIAAAVTASALGTGAGLAATASTASAATATTAAVTYKAPVLNHWHQMSVVYNGTTYSGYWVLLQAHRDGLLTGWLYDPYLPVGYQYLPVHGAASGPDVVFEASYGPSSVQGVRAFDGIISGGVLGGTWTQTGSQANGAGQTFTFTS